MNDARDALGTILREITRLDDRDRLTEHELRTLYRYVSHVGDKIHEANDRDDGFADVDTGGVPPPERFEDDPLFAGGE